MKNILSLALLLLLTILLACGATTFDASAQALTLWFEKLVPSLFAGMVLIRILDEQGILRWLAQIGFGWSEAVFHISPQAFSLVVASFFLGSPAGQILIDEYVADHRLDPPAARRLALCVCVSTPTFVLITCGAVLLQSMPMGLALWLAQLLAVMMLLFFTRGLPVRLKDTPFHSVPSLFESMRTSVIQSGISLYFIGAYLLMALVLIQLAALIIPARGLLPLQCVGEFSLGVEQVSHLPLPLSQRTLFMGLILGFASFSVHLQILSLTPHLQLRYRTFFLFRIAQCLLSGMILSLLLILLCWRTG